MSDNVTNTITNTITNTKPKTQRPRLYKVMPDYEAYLIMMAAHQQGNAVVSVHPRDVAESKANEATDMAKEAGHPLMFTIEPEE